MTLDRLIREAEASMAYGTVSLTLKKHDGKITTVDTTKITSRSVDSNAQALTLVGSMLKLLSEAQESGNLTFTLTLNKGTTQRLMTNEFKRVNL